MPSDGSEPQIAAGEEVSRDVPVFEPGTNKRPQSVVSLLTERELHSEWFIHANRKNRFFVTNLGTVLNLLPIGGHTKAGSYFKEAERIVREETEWGKQYAFEYRSHPRHLSDQKRLQAKLFGHAATIIVAMEVAAQQLKTQVNVYDLLRILPAHFFVDLFDQQRLTKLIEVYDAMPEADKVTRFGPEKAGFSFERQCLSAIAQPNSDDLLKQVTSGHCLTKFTAGLLMSFVNTHFDSALHVGPVLVSGADAARTNLGTDSVAPSLRVPRTLSPIPVCA